MISLLYVSLPMVDLANRDSCLDDIQTVSIAHNSKLDLTGLLITTRDYFAQLLEGEEDAVESVMTRISRDHPAPQCADCTKLINKNKQLSAVADCSI